MNKREYNVDVLRIIAFTFVICVHNLGNTGFNQQVTKGGTMLVYNVMRCLFITCVPLYMVITGYLQNKKVFNSAYVWKLSKVLISYLTASIFCLVAFLFYNGSELTIKVAI